MHRNLTPSAILVEKVQGLQILKICGFGLSVAEIQEIDENHGSGAPPAY